MTWKQLNSHSMLVTLFAKIRETQKKEQGITRKSSTKQTAQSKESTDIISSNSVSFYTVIAFSLNKKPRTNPTITQSYHHCPHMLTMAAVLDDILFISVAKRKLN